MHPLSKTHKIEISPMKVGLILLSVFVDKLFSIYNDFAYTRCKLFVTSQIVRNIILNIGKSGFANLLNPIRLVFYTSLFNFYKFSY